ncbi:MAG: hypothetical protein ACM31L_01425 [Actinomycetota bacterium]
MEAGKIIQAFMAKAPVPGREQADSLAPVLDEATQAVLAELDRLRAAEGSGAQVAPAERLHVLTLLMACAEYARALADDGRAVLPEGTLARLAEALQAEPAPVRPAVPVPAQPTATVLPLAAAGRALRPRAAAPVAATPAPAVGAPAPVCAPAAAEADDDRWLADRLELALQQITMLMR